MDMRNRILVASFHQRVLRVIAIHSFHNPTSHCTRTVAALLVFPRTVTDTLN